MTTGPHDFIVGRPLLGHRYRHSLRHAGVQVCSAGYLAIWQGDRQSEECRRGTDLSQALGPKAGSREF